MSDGGSDLDLIVRAARRAGAEALSRQGGLAEADIMRKPDATRVTSADLAVNRILQDMLMDARPDYGWLSEESSDDPARLTKEHTFVIDPIDGTEAFINGQPDYVVSIAVVRDGRPVAAALAHPAQDAIYAAAPGAGATRNGAPLRVRDWPDLAGGRLVAATRDLKPEIWRTPWPESLTVGYGTAMAYRLAMVADGEWHGALSLTGKCDWDLAAADLILSEAGGLITGLDGAPLRYNQTQTRKTGLAGGAPQFHAALMRRLHDLETGRFT